ncbi:CHASE domain-containing protein [Draconibacterium sp. IB214405]|uniref:CHASE domain-containing protein n=1 Tax=Draconibacterium sp. IB214405 TaxID=3097352 RepID=UPI002A0C20E8|nr:CHASE domain-containing protein [Draconibacterium sp. IB214405]MDX8337928.1 CHASE domain-containing protein [Draconibacterium sp. IB214405]
MIQLSKVSWKAFLVLIIGVLITGALTYATHLNLSREENKDFGMVCQEIKTKIMSRLYAHAQLLRSGAAYVIGSDEVTRVGWHDFIEKSKIDKNLPGIQGVGYSVVVPENKLSELTQIIRNEGFPEFHIYPEGKRDTYTAIIYLEPFDFRNQRAFGYDMYSEPVRRKAMEQARDYDLAALTGKVLLVQETNEDLQAGSLMYVPVYKKDKPMSTIAERREAFVGWVYSPYRMDDLMNGILGRWDAINSERIHLQIYDNEDITAEALLFDSQHGKVNEAPEKTRTLGMPIEFNGKTWTLYFQQSNKFEWLLSNRVIIVFIGGLVTSLLLFFLTSSLQNTKTKALLIAERLTAELKESEEKFKTLADTSPMAIYMSTGIEQTAEYINHTFVDLFGYTIEEVPNFNQWWPLAYPNKEYRERLEKEWQEKVGKAIKTKSEIDPIEAIVKCKDGSEKNITWGFKTIGKQNWAYGLDLTKRKQVEQRLIEMNENLEEMVYITSHDLQVPLISMEGYASELLEDYDSELDENGKFCLLRLKNNAQSMHNLIKSLLDISRLNTKIHPFETFDLNVIVEKILMDLALFIENKKANIVVEDLPKLHADKYRIETVFRNLIVNALVYGGKKITIGAKNNILFVADDGIGIPKDQLFSIFKAGERLMQIDTDGVGMGLTFCKKVIEKHQWDLWAESEGVGKGTTLKIRYRN